MLRPVRALSSSLLALAEYPCQDVDTSRHHAVSHSFRLSAVHYFDELDRFTVIRAAGAGSSSRPIFCPLGVKHCAFDPKRVARFIENARRSEIRARRTVVELARCNALDHLLTLTAGTHIGGRTEALDTFSTFLADRRHGRWFAGQIEGYVAVAEPFSGGGWHLHVGIRGGLRPGMLLRLKESWTRFLASSCGIPAPREGAFWRVNVAPPRSRYSPVTLGEYLAKHLAAPSKGRRSYRCAHGMARALRESVVALLTTATAFALITAFGRPQRVVHPRSGAILGWACEGAGARQYLQSLCLEGGTS